MRKEEIIQYVNEHATGTILSFPDLVTIYALLGKTNNYKKCDLDCNHEVNYQKVMDWIESNLKSEEYNGIGTLIYKGLKTECDILTIRSYRDKTYLDFP